MFSIEVKINGIMIAYIHGRNIEHIPDKQDDVCLYTYDLYDTNKGIVEKGNVLHKRDEGILKLIKRILDKTIK